MKAEIIAVGSEIMLGDINNSHAMYISQKLASLGIDVLYHTAVGDNESRLERVVSEAVMRSDIVITTGGLGPTADDLTKEVVCQTLGVELYADAKVLDEIKGYFARIGREMPAQNAKQALVPKGSIVLHNLHGTAPGIILESQGREKIVIMLPGPPSELIPMFDGGVCDYLKELTNEVIISKNLSVIGIGESRVEAMTDDLLSGSNPSAALYAGTGQVRIRLTAKAKTENEALELLTPLEAEFRKRLGDTVYSDCGESLEQTVVNLLRKKELKLACAESCTGGLLSEKITGVSGSSEVFEFGLASYSNRIKSKYLNVSEKTLYLYGAVSEHTAIQMALGAKKKSGADIAVGITGFAGPSGGNEHNPVGTVYIAVANGDKIWTHRITAGHGKTAERALVREIAALTALDMVRHLIIDSPKSALYLKTVSEAFESCADPVIKTGEYTPRWLRVLKALVPWKGDPLQEIIRKSIILLAAVIFIVSAVVTISYFTQKIISDNVVNQTQSLYSQTPTSEQIYNLPSGYLDKFAGLYSENQDIKGWITIPDSKIDFPVVQSTDNEYYLQHDFYKNYNSNGIPFLDYRNDISGVDLTDDNTVIYAHNIKGGRFFSELCNYSDLDYYKERPVITFDSVYNEMQWVIVACYITNSAPEQDDGEVFLYHNYLNFTSKAQFDWYMEEVNRRSIINTGVEVEYGEKLLTLSTCTYEFDDARFVLVARKIRIGEDTDASEATYANNPLYPQAYYDKHGGSKPELPDNPEPVTADQIADDEDNIPFYELISSYNADNYSFPDFSSDKSSSYTSSSFINRYHAASSTKSNTKTVSSGYTSSKKTSSKKTSSKKTSSKKTSSKKATSSKSSASSKASASSAASSKSETSSEATSASPSE